MPSQQQPQGVTSWWQAPSDLPMTASSLAPHQRAHSSVPPRMHPFGQSQHSADARPQHLPSPTSLVQPVSPHSQHLSSASTLGLAQLEHSHPPFPGTYKFPPGPGSTSPILPSPSDGFVENISPPSTSSSYNSQLPNDRSTTVPTGRLAATVNPDKRPVTSIGDPNDQKDVAFSWNSPSGNILGNPSAPLTVDRQVRLPSISEGFGHYHLLMDSAYKPQNVRVGAYQGSTSGLPNLARFKETTAPARRPSLVSSEDFARSTTFPTHQLEELPPETQVSDHLKDELLKVYFAWVQPLWPIIYRPRPEQWTVEYAEQTPLLFNAQCAWAAAMIDPKKHGMDCSNKALSALFRYRCHFLFSETRCEASVEAIQALHVCVNFFDAQLACLIRIPAYGSG